ncbi:MAG: redoxin family protein [Pirellulales bacterium]
MAGKPTLLSVVPSLDTGVCAIQTKKFNEELNALGDKINAVTVSRDLSLRHEPFLRSRRDQGDEGRQRLPIKRFGNAFGVMIDELKLLPLAVFVLDKDGKVTYSEIVPEVTQEPNYAAALEALKKLVGWSVTFPNVNSRSRAGTQQSRPARFSPAVKLASYLRLT